MDDIEFKEGSMTSPPYDKEHSVHKRTRHEGGAHHMVYTHHNGIDIEGKTPTQ